MQCEDCAHGAQARQQVAVAGCSGTFWVTGGADGRSSGMSVDDLDDLPTRFGNEIVPLSGSSVPESELAGFVFFAFLETFFCVVLGLASSCLAQPVARLKEIAKMNTVTIRNRLAMNINSLFFYSFLGSAGLTGFASSAVSFRSSIFRRAAVVDHVQIPNGRDFSTSGRMVTLWPVVS